MPTGPGVVVPPPLIFLGGFAVGLALETVTPTPGPPPAVAGAVAVAGILAWAVLDGTAMREFRRAGTTVLPWQASAALVSSGPYRWTRNPMYVGMALLHAALAIAFGVLWALALLAAVILVIDRMVVPREERAMRDTFGEAYDAFRQQVRRWV
jgi:protein-S-isoprenylcysteine O-methyltransferase Ste14